MVQRGQGGGARPDFQAVEREEQVAHIRRNALLPAGEFERQGRGRRGGRYRKEGEILDQLIVFSFLDR